MFDLKPIHTREEAAIFNMLGGNAINENSLCHVYPVRSVEDPLYFEWLLCDDEECNSINGVVGIVCFYLYRTVFGGFALHLLGAYVHTSCRHKGYFHESLEALKYQFNIPIVLLIEDKKLISRYESYFSNDDDVTIVPIL